MTQIPGLQGQLLTHQGSTYLVQGGTMDGEGHPLTHTTRASPATVRHHSKQLLSGMSAMAAASFSAVSRAVYRGLRVAIALIIFIL
jgi:hypothetical protein